MSAICDTSSEAMGDCLDALFEHRVLVCAGAGGVGKTTVSAALSVAGARRGKRVLALTIDPAKRLADSLGVETAESQRQYLSDVVCQELGIASRSLSVLVLDPRKTLYDLVNQLAPSPALAEQILAHRLFRYIADYLAGANEFMAMEKLLSVLSETDFDLLVLDTPPSRHALDFLRAPERLTDAIDGPVMRTIARAVDDARRFSIDWVAKGTELLVRGLGKITGAGLLQEVATLIAELNMLFGGFQTHAKRISEAFRDQSFGYVLVTRPRASAVVDTQQFAAALSELRIKADAVIANAVHAPFTSAKLDAVQPALNATFAPALVDRVQAACSDRIRVTREEAIELAELQRVASHTLNVPLLLLPSVAGGVPNVSALGRIASQFRVAELPTALRE